MNQDLSDKLDIINHVNLLAFDRSTGTVEETKTTSYIQEELAKVNITSQREYFSYVGPKRVFMRLAYLILLTYFIVYRLWLVIAVFFALKYMSKKLREFSLIEKEGSKNLVANIPARRTESKQPVLIFSAHYDSFSSSLPYRLQNVFFFIFRIIILPYFLLTAIFSFYFILDYFNPLTNKVLVINIAILTTLIEFVIITMIFLLIFNNQKSKGSIDNASGVSILIELAKILKTSPLNNLNVIFLFCGAEEWGLKGSQDFCQKHLKELKEKYDLNNSYNINIDMVGSYVGLLDKTGLIRKKRVNTKLNNLLEQSAKELNIPIVNYNKIRGPKSDYRSFVSLAKRTRTSFQVACIQSEEDSKYIHSSKDTPDRCSNKILNECLDICYKTISYLDSL
ncbi:MAG: M28 family metallopeptidase [Candidatus Hermodarchaeota archaeon]